MSLLLIGRFYDLNDYIITNNNKTIFNSYYKEVAGYCKINNKYRKFTTATADKERSFDKVSLRILKMKWYDYIILFFHSILKCKIIDNSNLELDLHLIAYGKGYYKLQSYNYYMVKVNDLIHIYHTCPYTEEQPNIEIINEDNIIHMVSCLFSKKDFINSAAINYDITGIFIDDDTAKELISVINEYNRNTNLDIILNELTE